MQLCFAGIWGEWISPKGNKQRSCVILTTEANTLMRNIHQRMPVILSPSDGINWLKCSEEDEAHKKILYSFPSEDLLAWKVKKEMQKML